MSTRTRYEHTTEPDAYRRQPGEILRVLVGSTMHGIGLPGGEDEDLMGIVVEPPDVALGIRPWETTIRRTQPEGARSGHGDIDLTLYSLRKWARLAAGGNPSVLLPLFVHDDHIQVWTEHGDRLRSHAHLFVTRAAGHAFCEYMTAQLERLTGERGGKHTNRPELVDAHGYDVKYASHVLRLGAQGVELMTTGRLTLPIQDPWGEYLRSVRRGEEPLVAVLAKAHELRGSLSKSIADADLPAKADAKAISTLIADIYRSAWLSPVNTYHHPEVA